jgi:hypothetical protein
MAGAGAPVRAALLAGALLAVAFPATARGQAAPRSPADRPPIPHAGHRYIHAVNHADRHVLEVIIGPVRLPAGMHHYRVPTQVVDVPDVGWIRGFSWEITDSAGAHLPDDLLHHVNLIDPDRRQLFTPISRRIMAAGRETRAASLPPVIGIPTHPDMRLVVASMFANSSEASFDRAFLHVRLDYVPREGALVRPLDAYPLYMDVMGPLGVKDFSVPPGHSEQSWEGSPAVDGRILGLGTHMHDFCTQVRLEDLTTGELLWSARPYAGPDGRVYGAPMARFWLEGGLPIRHDHTYRVTVVYRNPLDHPTVLGGMGLVAGLFVPASGAEQPAMDRDDPTYRQDLWNTVTAPMRTIHGMMSSHETEQAGPAPADMFSGAYADAGETGPVAGPEPGAMKSMPAADHDHPEHPH